MQLPFPPNLPGGVNPTSSPTNRVICSGSAGTWILLLLTLAGVGFFWYKTAQVNPDHKPQSPQSETPSTTSTNYQVTRVRPGVLVMSRTSNALSVLLSSDTNLIRISPVTNKSSTSPAIASNSPGAFPQVGFGSNASLPKVISPATVTNGTASRAVAHGTNTAQQTSFTYLDTNTFPRGVQNIFEAQVALERLGISSGAIDGLMGSQTRSALRAFQREWGLAETSELDSQTCVELILERSPYTELKISSNDLARLQPVSKTWLGKSSQTAMEFETALEMVAERSHSHPNLIKRLNPAVNWTNIQSGAVLQVPDVRPAPDRAKASWVTIKLGEKVLQVFDSDENLVAHFPCSIAQRVEKRPVGDLHVVVAAENPDYTFDPAVFPESAEARRLKTKLLIPPGPNNPVGTAWIGLDKPGYGIHGTPAPEQVGRTESHGCFRLANWNAERLISLVGPGTPVYVKP